MQEAGFRTLTAMHAEEARLLERHASSVAVLFSDVVMPGSINGFHLAHRVARRWPDIVVLVASGRAAPGLDGLLDSATFIRKRFSTEVVHARLHEILPEGRNRSR